MIELAASLSRTRSARNSTPPSCPRPPSCGHTGPLKWTAAGQQNGGACSLLRTRLWIEIPDLQRKYREIAQIPASGRGQRLRSGPVRRPSRRVPCVREQGNFCQRARIPAKAPHAGPRATIVPASSIRELLAFSVGRLLAHYAHCPHEIRLRLGPVRPRAGPSWPRRHARDLDGLDANDCENEVLLGHAAAETGSGAPDREPTLPWASSAEGQRG